MKTSPLIVAIMAGAMLATGTASARQAPGPQARGKAVAEKLCAPCHATGRSGASAARNAPPLRSLGARYPLESLEEAFAEGIMVTHKGQDMPPFELQPRTISDLIAFLKSVQAKRPR